MHQMRQDTPRRMPVRLRRVLHLQNAQTYRIALHGEEETYYGSSLHNDARGSRGGEYCGVR